VLLACFAIRAMLADLLNRKDSAMQKPLAIRNLFAAIVLVGAMSACAAVSGRETTGEYVDDATITTKVKAKIAEDSVLKAFQIHVETFQDVVQLSGFVDLPTTKSKAEVLARNVEGVREVRNSIVVR
jgi:hyperosmotically inducible protein